jgi:hypothetical protein
MGQSRERSYTGDIGGLLTAYCKPRAGPDPR